MRMRLEMSREPSRVADKAAWNVMMVGRHRGMYVDMMFDETRRRRVRNISLG